MSRFDIQNVDFDFVFLLIKITSKMYCFTLEIWHVDNVPAQSYYVLYQDQACLREVAVPVLSPSVAFCCTVFTAMASRAASDCTGTSAVRHRESESSLPPSQHSVQSKHTNHLISVVFRNSPAVTWDFDCHKLSILLILVQKYDSYKQCLLRHLPSCTKPFRGLYGEKREKKMLHKIIPTGEKGKRFESPQCKVSDNHVF